MGQAKLKAGRKEKRGTRAGKRLLEVVLIRAQINIYNDRGKLADMQTTQDIPLLEADIPESVVQFLRARGLEFDDAPESPVETSP